MDFNHRKYLETGIHPSLDLLTGIETEICSTESSWFTAVVHNLHLLLSLSWILTLGTGNRRWNLNLGSDRQELAS